MNKTLYCPVGEPQRKFGVYVTGAGHEITKPGEPYPHDYHSSDYYFTWDKGRALADWEYQILYIRSGKGVIEFQRGKRIRIKAGTAIILHPGEWHRYRPDQKTGWSEAYIGIGGDFLSRIVSPPFFSESPTIIRTKPGDSFERELLQLVDDIQTHNIEQPYSIALRVLTLLSTLVEATKIQNHPATSNVAIRRAHLYIAHHLGEVVDFAALAKRVGMGYSMFRKKFLAYTKMAPLEYQLALRLRRAANLLANSETPIAKIAKETGFQSPAYFSRFFHKNTGLSPILYRKRHSETIRH